MPNPFFFGPRISDPAQFVGREKELRTIFSALETAHTGQLQHVQITGPRRIGKSSLLYHVTQIYTQRLQHPEKYRFVYVDLMKANCQTQAGLLHFILSQLGISKASQPTLARFQEGIENFCSRRGLYPVLCLDEFEQLTKRRDEFPDAVFEAWRSLGNASQMAFLTASQHSLGELIRQGNLTSTFHNIFTPLKLGEYTEKEARSLLAQNVDRPFTEVEIKKLFKLTRYHPAHLQIGAMLLYNARETPPVDWGALETEYKERVASVLPVEPPQEKNNWFVPMLTAIFLSFPTALGKFILEVVLRIPNPSERNAAILGWIILGLIILTLLGFSLQEALAPWLQLLISNN